MGENLILFYKGKIKRSWKIAFYTAFLACLLIHIYKFANTLPNHDSFYNVYVDQDMTVSGRWFLSFACGISSYFDLPWINGFLSAVYLGITAAIITALFDLKNPVVIMLSSMILAASPSTTETFFFGFTADGYMVGLLLSALAAYLSCRGSAWWHFGLSAVCLCLSCAIYQAYISFAIVLSTCYLVNTVLDNKISVRNAWKWIGRHVLIYVPAMIAYYVIWKLILFMTGCVATGNQGINQVGVIGVSTLVHGFAKSIRNILLFFLECNILEHPITLYAKLNIIFLIALTFIVIVAVAKSGTHRKASKFLTVLFCLAASVPMVSIWCFLSEGVTYRPMMLHSACVYYIFALILFDKWMGTKLSTIFGLFMTVVVFNFAIMANISYFYLNKSYEKSYYVGTQIMERIEDTENMSSSEIHSVAFIGNRMADVALIATDSADTGPANKIHMLAQLVEQDLLYDHAHAYLYLIHVFGLDIPAASSQERVELEDSEEVDAMGIWPAKDSVAVIDGILVIKLSESAG